jgi:MFS family permease
MAVTFSAGSLLTGLLADWAGRHGIGLKAVIASSFIVLGAAELGLIFNVPLPAWLLVGALGLAGSGTNLTYVMLGDQFGPAMAGRAQTSLNLLLFLAAALLQSGIGWLLDLLVDSGLSTDPATNYAMLFGLLFVLQSVTVLWFTGLKEPNPRQRR